MNFNIKKPLAVFDIEATGINTVTEKIIEISILRIEPNGKESINTYRINPDMPIPAESTEIHGITDDDVKDKPLFKDLAKEINKQLEGCDLGGYNLLKFDIPILVEEFLKCDIDFDIRNRNIIDAQKIFYLMEPRTLSAAYKFFCNKSLENAHSAEADTIATFEVIKAQLERYNGVEIEDKEGNLYTPVTEDINSLHKISMSNNVDLAGRMVFNSKGVAVFNFGKYKNQSVEQVLQKDPAYYGWIMNNEFSLDTKRKLTEIKLKGALKRK